MAGRTGEEGKEAGRREKSKGQKGQFKSKVANPREKSRLDDITTGKMVNPRWLI